MWKFFGKIITNAVDSKFPLLAAETTTFQQTRSTAILKRTYPVRLHRKGFTPKKLKSKNYIYELVKVEDTTQQPDIEVILTQHVEGLGNRGDKISIRPNHAYNYLLLPGLAVYVTPENIKKYEVDDSKNQEERHSSPFATYTVSALSRIVLSVIMNKENPWILQPWHVRASFRKCGYIVPDEAITMPEKTIKGPDMNIEGKEFYVTVTVNNLEQQKVRCRIHHWSTSALERIPYEFEFWKTPGQPIFPEDAEVLNSLIANANRKVEKSTSD